MFEIKVKALTMFDVVFSKTSVCDLLISAMSYVHENT